MEDSESIMFISSNVGSLFEHGKILYENWKNELGIYIGEKNPAAIILNLQEFGGKSPLVWDDANWFLGQLFETFKTEFPTFVSFVDCDMVNEVSYTALCSVIMVSKSIKDFELYNFLNEEYIEFKNGYHVHQIYGCSDICYKEKFPLNHFPHQRWSRKGFLLNRIRLQKTKCIDIVNLHLIHDSNCLLSVEKPSPFEKFRKLQFDHIIQKLKSFSSKSAVLFGDFNFRTSLTDVITSHEIDFTVHHDSANKKDARMYFKSVSGDTILASVTSKELRMYDKLLPNYDNNLAIHKSGDKELDRIDHDLFEFPILFLPTYCYLTTGPGCKYDEKRFPSWCDRILFKGEVAEKLKEKNAQLNGIFTYEALGLEISMGDHKPVSAIIPLNFL